MDIYSKIQDYFEDLIAEKNIDDENIVIKVKGLTPEEAIGATIRKDFPLLLGKEVMLEADFKGTKGQAFTSARVEDTQKLSEVKKLPIGENPYNTAIFFACLNAVMSHYGLVSNTIHCKGEKTENCARDINRYMEENHPGENIALIGYQPAMLDRLSHGKNPVRVLDLNIDNIGDIRYGVVVEDGKQHYDEVVNQWADVILCTGSTIVNGSIINFLNLEKPVYFYGNTIAGAAIILSLKRLCFESE